MSANRVNFRTMIDPRDGQEYKTVTIGKQTWMAENLNYETANSYCYENHINNCRLFGRLYEWKNALNACPVGFHLPTLQEWETLFESIGGLEFAGNALKSIGEWEMGWPYHSGKGTDAYGFGALPAGFRNDNGTFTAKRLYAEFWSSTEVGPFWAYNLHLSHDSLNVVRNEGTKKSAFSVRCLKGKPQKTRNSKPDDHPVYSKGFLKDSRDGKKYRTVRMGEQIWMAENLNYNAAGSECYKNSLENCQKYGRFYTWSVAKNVCPSGYHLPSLDEWKILFESIGRFESGKILKSKTGWINGRESTDDYGFSAFPIGGSNGFEGEQACFWSYADYDNETAYYMVLKNMSDMAYLLAADGKNKYSVRCLKNEASKSGGKDKLSNAVNNVPVRGSMKDSRDGKTYRTVRIGKQTWMAENLKYKTKESYCYKDLVNTCDLYGLLYTWAAAIDSVGAFSSNGKGCGYKKACALIYPVRGVCPVGWHLPTLVEWNELIDAVGGKDSAASKLKSMDYWNRSGSDDYGFSAYPAGYRSGNGSYFGDANFWTSTEIDIYSGFYVVLEEDNSRGHVSESLSIEQGYKSKTYALSIRCVKD